MRDKIMKCVNGYSVIIDRWSSLYRIHSVAKTTACHPHLYQAINEWNLMQGAKAPADALNYAWRVLELEREREGSA
jgi:hypothetical protein